MAENKHTPGPWWAYECRGLHFITSGEQIAIAVCHDAALGNGDDKANACLIAAAPELYEIAAAIEHRANQCGGDYDDIPRDDLSALLVRFNDALAKARGEL